MGRVTCYYISEYLVSYLEVIEYYTAIPHANVQRGFGLSEACDGCSTFLVTDLTNLLNKAQ